MTSPDDLTPGQRRRLVELARSEVSLPWVEGDELLAAKFLIARFEEPFGGSFADLTGKGSALAHRIARER